MTGPTFVEGVAVVAAFVAGGGEDRLTLRGCLLEEEVLGLEHAWLSLLHCLLAETPARADGLVGVVVDDRGVLVERTEGRVRSLVDVDGRAGRKR